MALRFCGDYRSLKECVSRTKFDGDWRELENHHKQYRTDDGAILNWWERTGTILFQGNDENKEFENAFVAIASAKGRLEIKGNKSGKEEQAWLRDLVEEAQTVIAQLNWRELRNESRATQIIIASELTDIAKVIRRL